jgi:hypothetical protein
MHDILGVSLHRAGYQVKSLPRQVIALLQMNTYHRDTTTMTSQTDINNANIPIDMTMSTSSSSSSYNNNNPVGTDTKTLTQSQSDELLLQSLCPENILNLLAPFQKEAVTFAVMKNGRILIADEMGLGM